MDACLLQGVWSVHRDDQRTGSRGCFESGNLGRLFLGELHQYFHEIGDFMGFA